MYNNTFYDDLQKLAETRPVQIHPPASYNSPTFSHESLMHTIYDIPNLSDVQLRNFIQNYYVKILDNVFSGPDRSNHLLCFTDKRFLDAFIDVLQLETFYDITIIVKCNNICYDYITLPNSDPEIVSRMMKISAIVNRPKMPKLIGFGLRQDVAAFILLARYSSFNLEICVRRVNHILRTQPKVIMNLEMITEIFNCLYTHSDWVPAFQYFMHDVIPEYSENSWVTEEVEEVDSTINLAILDILNSEPTSIISDAIINYAEDRRLINGVKPYKFSLMRLSDDYYRIKGVIEYLKQDGIIVP